MDLEAIRVQYLGQPVREFVENDGDPREYAHLVFTRQVFGPGEDPAAPNLGIDTEDDLVAALEALIARDEEARAIRLAALEQHREGTQFQPLDPTSPTVTLQVRVPQSLLDVVDAAAARAGVTRSEFVRAALEAAARR